jgi:hypothetical protein
VVEILVDYRVPNLYLPFSKKQLSQQKSSLVNLKLKAAHVNTNQVNREPVESSRDTSILMVMSALLNGSIHAFLN